MSEIEKAIEILKASNNKLLDYMENKLLASINNMERIIPTSPTKTLIVRGYETIEKCKAEHDAVNLAISTLCKIERGELVEVTYCKDCKHSYSKPLGGNFTGLACSISDKCVGRYMYCAYSGRSEGE